MNGGYHGREWGNCSMALYYLVIQMSKNWVWWLMPVREPEFRGSLGYILIAYLKRKRIRFRSSS